MERVQQQLTLYLASWQKRMMKDFMSREQLIKIQLSKVTQMRIKNPKGQCLASYKIPPDGIRKGDWVIYLTDEQMNIVSSKLNLRVPVSSINITEKDLRSGAISFV